MTKSKEFKISDKHSWERICFGQLSVVGLKIFQRKKCGILKMTLNKTTAYNSNINFRYVKKEFKFTTSYFINGEKCKLSNTCPHPNSLSYGIINNMSNNTFLKILNEGQKLTNKTYERTINKL